MRKSIGEISGNIKIIGMEGERFQIGRKYWAQGECHGVKINKRKEKVRNWVGEFTQSSDYFQLFGINEDLKHTAYEYDLVSGNVNKVLYNPNKSDAFYHKYEYDADNRIKRAYTSLDNLIWDEDAKYNYYAHGPLARTEIGDLKVQGLDYVYTLHGWLKSVNSNTMDRTRDPSRDGDISIPANPFANFGGDVFGYSLGYYNDNAGTNQKDYKSIQTFLPQENFLAKVDGSDLLNDRNDLYNGNIGHMVTTIPDQAQYSSSKIIASSAKANAYKYDQLNRISASRSFDNINLTTNEWGNAGPVNQNYASDYTYDPMGNIKTLKRYNGTGAIMDDLTYKYNIDPISSNLISNKLYHVNDAAGQIGTNDLADQGTFNSSSILLNNYLYDESGNLIKT